MEITKIETAAVEALVSDVQREEINTLNDLQLALIGGGIAVVVFG